MPHQQNLYLPAESDPRSAYVHIPFCRYRCGYCNFALVAGRDHLVESFLDALEKDIQSLPQKYEIDTLFFGGGTPSHLSHGQLLKLREIVFSRFELASEAEVSAECNPADISDSKLKALELIEVNRISLGVQSFSDDKLKLLQRDHDAEVATGAFELAMEKFGNVSMDLIFAAPGETLEQWCRDLDTAVSLRPSHLSTYELTWEKGTTFWNRKQKGELTGSSEDLSADMYLSAIERCDLAGLKQYEVSSFAIDGKRCRHNMQYWLCNPWFAFGPGAASFVGGTRQTNHRSTTTWIRKTLSGESPIAEVESLTSRDRAIERLIFGLRMIDGIDIGAFEVAINESLDDLAGKEISSLRQRGLLAKNGNRLALTPQGLMIADSVSAELL